MKTLIKILLLLVCLPCSAVNIFFNLSDFSANPTTNRTVFVQSFSVPTVNQSSVVVGDKLKYITDTNGQFTITNATLNLLYQVQVTAPPKMTTFLIFAPTSISTNANYNGNQLLVASGTSTFPAGSVAWSAAYSDFRYISSSNSVPNGYGPIATNGGYVWAPLLGSGTVTSVGLSLPAWYDVTQSPVTGAGTLTAKINTQPAAFASVVATNGFQLKSSPTSGFVLTSDASGNGTWQASQGVGTSFVGNPTQFVTNGAAVAISSNAIVTNMIFNSGVNGQNQTFNDGSGNQVAISFQGGEFNLETIVGDLEYYTVDAPFQAPSLNIIGTAQVGGNATFAGNGTPASGKVPTGTDSSGNWTWQVPASGNAFVGNPTQFGTNQANSQVQITNGALVTNLINQTPLTVTNTGGNTETLNFYGDPSHGGIAQSIIGNPSGLVINGAQFPHVGGVTMAGGNFVVDTSGNLKLAANGGTSSGSIPVANDSTGDWTWQSLVSSDISGPFPALSLLTNSASTLNLYLRTNDIRSISIGNSASVFTGTLNGNAQNVTGIVAPANGGTGGTNASAASTAFTVNTIPGLVAWFQADQINQANNTSVSSWPDSSGNGNAAVQAAGGSQPTFKTAQLNGLPGVSFSGSQWLETPFFIDSTYNSNFTTFLVANCSANTSLKVIASMSGSGAFGTSFTMLQSADLYGYGDGLGGSLSANFFSGMFDSTRPSINTFRCLTNFCENRINGQGGFVQSNVASFGLGAASAYFLGSETTNHNSFTGNIYEALVFHGQLSVSQCQTVETYLNNKWGICKNTILFVGDSLTDGINSTGGSNYPAQTLALLAAQSGFDAVNSGQFGQSAQTINTLFQERHDYYLNKPQAAVVWAGINDLVIGFTTNQTIGFITNSCLDAKRRGMKTVTTTILPATGSPVLETNRIAINGFIRANWRTFADAISDVGADPAIGYGSNAVFNTTYYAADKTHLTDAGYAIVAKYAASALSACGAIGPYNPSSLAWIQNPVSGPYTNRIFDTMTAVTNGGCVTLLDCTQPSIVGVPKYFMNLGGGILIITNYTGSQLFNYKWNAISNNLAGCVFGVVSDGTNWNVFLPYMSSSLYSVNSGWFGDPTQFGTNSITGQIQITNGADATNLFVSTLLASTNNFTNYIGGSPFNFIVFGSGGFNSVLSGIQNDITITNGIGATNTVIAGGALNQIIGGNQGDFIGGGVLNTVGDNLSTFTFFSTVLGGFRNSIAGGNLVTEYGTISGGQHNSILTNLLFSDYPSWGVTIPGGMFNNASGLGSFAAGVGASATNSGTFVWSDSQDGFSSPTTFGSTSTNQFLIRARGGVGINTNNPSGNALTVSGNSQFAGNGTPYTNSMPVGTDSAGNWQWQYQSALMPVSISNYSGSFYQALSSAGTNLSVYIPPGNYTLTNTVVLTNCVNLICDKASFITFTGSNYAIDLRANSNKCYITGLNLAGTNNINWNRAGPFDGSAIHSTNQSGVACYALGGWIRNCYFQGFGSNAVYVDSLGNDVLSTRDNLWSFRNNIVSNCYCAVQTGLTDGSEYLDFTDNHIKNCCFGYYFQSPNYTVVGNTIVDAFYGIEVQGNLLTNTYRTHGNITANTINHCTYTLHEGGFTHSATGLNFEDNTCLGNGGMLFGFATNIIVRHNWFEFLSFVGTTTLQGNCEFSGNRALNPGATFAPASSQWLMFDNLYQSNGLPFTTNNNLFWSSSTNFVNNALIVGAMTNAPSFTLIQTNWVAGFIYTNLTGRPILASVNAVLTESGVAGQACMSLEMTNYLTNYSADSTIITSIAANRTNVLSGFVPNNQTFCFTNRSTGSGDSASILGGQYMVY